MPGSAELSLLARDAGAITSFVTSYWISWNGGPTQRQPLLQSLENTQSTKHSCSSICTLASSCAGQLSVALLLPHILSQHWEKSLHILYPFVQPVDVPLGALQEVLPMEDINK